MSSISSALSDFGSSSTTGFGEGVGDGEKGAEGDDEVFASSLLLVLVVTPLSSPSDTSDTTFAFG